MNTQILEGKWKQLRGEIQEQWGELTGDDLDLITGRREQLEGKLRERYGWSKRKARKEVDKFMRDLNGQAEDARHKVKERVQEAQSKMEETVQEAQEKLQQRVAKTKDVVEATADEYNMQARESAPEEMVYVVDEYPWLVIAGALLFGVLIGVLLSPSKG